MGATNGNSNGKGPLADISVGIVTRAGLVSIALWPGKKGTLIRPALGISSKGPDGKWSELEFDSLSEEDRRLAVNQMDRVNEANLAGKFDHLLTGAVEIQD